MRPPDSEMGYNLLKLLYSSLTRALIPLILLQVQACANLPVEDLPPELNLVKIGTSEADTPYAPSPDGEWLALVQNGLKLMDLKTDQTIQLTTDSPVALAWNHSGDRLIAAFSNSGESILQVFGTDGGIISQSGVGGTLSDMAWGSDNRITLATITREKYSFGSTLFTKFWQWDNVGRPTLLTESSVTIKPGTVKFLGAQLDKTAKLSISPLGDEVIYTKLLDPPAVRPYMKILLHHLETGIEREVAQVVLTLGDAFLLYEDMILFSDGINEVELLDPWTGLTIQRWQAAGHKLSVSAAGQYVLADGQLFDDNKQITNFSPTVDGLFATDGSLFLRYQNQLYLLSGLQKEKIAALAPENRQLLLKIRKWRSQGLITHQDFLSQKKRILE